MLKKSICFLLITILLMLSACHSNATTEQQIESSTSNTSSENIISCPSTPKPIFFSHCFTKGDYEEFLGNETLSIPLFSTDSLSAFGDFYNSFVCFLLERDEYPLRPRVGKAI